MFTVRVRDPWKLACLKNLVQYTWKWQEIAVETWKLLFEVVSADCRAKTGLKIRSWNQPEVVDCVLCSLKTQILLWFKMLTLPNWTVDKVSNLLKRKYVLFSYSWSCIIPWKLFSQLIFLIQNLFKGNGTFAMCLYSPPCLKVSFPSCLF
jgi:hypothetical protein